jgi:hypothetical protein
VPSPITLRTAGDERNAKPSIFTLGVFPRVSLEVPHKIAMDLYDRCITGLRLTPVSTEAIDAAAVLFDSVRPAAARARGRAGRSPPAYHGLPGQVIIDASRLADQDGRCGAVARRGQRAPGAGFVAVSAALQPRLRRVPLCGESGDYDDLLAG